MQRMCPYPQARCGTGVELARRKVRVRELMGESACVAQASWGWLQLHSSIRGKPVICKSGSLVLLLNCRNADLPCRDEFTLSSFRLCHFSLRPPLRAKSEWPCIASHWDLSAALPVLASRSYDAFPCCRFSFDDSSQGGWAPLSL